MYKVFTPEMVKQRRHPETNVCSKNKIKEMIISPVPKGFHEMSPALIYWRQRQQREHLLHSSTINLCITLQWMRGLEVKLTSISSSLPLQPHVTHTHLSGGVEVGRIIIGNDSAHIPADNVPVTGADAPRALRGQTCYLSDHGESLFPPHARM